MRHVVITPILRIIRIMGWIAFIGNFLGLRIHTRDSGFLCDSDLRVLDLYGWKAPACGGWRTRLINAPILA